MSAQMRRHSLLFFVALGLFFWGCGPEIPPASEIDKPRVLGVFYSADAEPARANPIPGETGSVEIVIGESTLR